ncbi:MAG: GNAT family N-acetyltransferase [Pseudomonadota bacterium]
MKWTFVAATEAAEYASRWDALNAAGARSPLLTSQFLGSALMAFGTGKEKLAILGDLLAPAAMAVVERSSRPGVWQTFQPSQAPIGFFLKRADLSVETVLARLLRDLPGLAVLFGLTQQDPLLIARPEPGVVTKTLDYIETASIDVGGAFEAYWEQRGKNLRQNLRKVRNKLDKAGLAIQLDCLTAADQMREAVASYGAMESKGWKSRQGTAISLDNDQGRFYLDLLTRHCQAGHGRVYQLRLGDQVVAMDICIDLEGVIVILKTTYDEAAAEYSPAMLMHHEIFQHLFESGEFRRIEFYGKVMEWHTRWTEDKRTMYHVNQYRWPLIKTLVERRSRPAPASAPSVETSQ